MTSDKSSVKKRLCQCNLLIREIVILLLLFIRFGYVKKKTPSIERKFFMTNFSELFAKTGWLISALTDWLLILLGGLLIVKALIAVDVPLARYLILALGVLLMGFGLWYRHRRLRRHRQQ